MNRIERTVYNMVRDNIRLKRAIRDIYQSAFDVIPVPATRCDYPVAIRPGFFFGFHDKSPFSADDRFLLGQKGLIPLRMPTPVDEAEIGVFSGEGWSEYRSLGRTRAWNWHQGSMLQWLGNGYQFTVNDFDGEKHVARVLDAETGTEVDRLPCPVAALAPGGLHFASYDFFRSGIGLAGYGYANGIDPEADSLAPCSHGLVVGNTATHERSTLFTVDSLARFEPDSGAAGAFHWISHVQFAPGGKRLKFFHRWVLPDKRWFTRMFSCNIDGSDLYLFPTNRMVSHVAWRDDRGLLAYARTSDGDGYYLFGDGDGSFARIGAEAFNCDGHPQFRSGGRYFVTDTYPDRLRCQRLYVYDMSENKVHLIAAFRSDKKFVGSELTDRYVVDLHPRWNRAGDVICFDSSHTGVRSLCTVRIPWLQAAE